MLNKITRVMMIIKMVHENQTLLSPLALLLSPTQSNNLELSHLDMVMRVMLVMTALMRITMVMMITVVMTIIMVVTVILTTGPRPTK